MSVWHGWQASAYQLKILQEVITLTVFLGFACLYLGESLRWNYALALLCLLAAAGFAFRGRS